MCFYNSMSKKAQALAKKYGRKTDLIEALREIIEEKQRNGEAVLDFPESSFVINAFPKKLDGVKQYKDYPIITSDDEIHIMKWGLIPYWVHAKENSPKAVADALEKAEKIRFGTLNARSETLFEKPSYRVPIKKRRCIIPSTGYFEFHYNPDGTKTPFYIYVENEEIFSMGGIWDVWLNPLTGEKTETFSMITTEANPLTYEIHNGGKNPHRMPLILKPEDEHLWLDPNLPDKDIVKLLVPFSEQDMDAYPIRSDFRDINPHDPSIIEKVA